MRPAERKGYQIETSPVATFSNPGLGPRPGSIGVPIWGVELKLVDSDWTEATAEVVRDAWLRTGDLARRDKDGFCHIVGSAVIGVPPSLPMTATAKVLKREPAR